MKMKGNNFKKIKQKSKYLFNYERPKYKKTLNDGLTTNYHSFRNVREKL